MQIRDTFKSLFPSLVYFMRSILSAVSLRYKIVTEHQTQRTVHPLMVAEVMDLRHIAAEEKKDNGKHQNRPYGEVLHVKELRHADDPFAALLMSFQQRSLVPAIIRRLF